MKKMPWFRMYTDFLNDPKLIALAFEDQRHFIGVLALKSDGALDENIDSDLMDRIVAQRLWIDHAIIREVKKRLIAAGLIDCNWQPLAWERRQFVSDSSAERVARHRAKRAEQGLPQQNYITPSTREHVFQRDGYECVYCGEDDDLTIDHAYPQSLGGGNDVGNLLTACRKCNAAKRDMTYEDYCKRKGIDVDERYCNVTVTRYIQRTDTEEKKDKPKGLSKEKTRATKLPKGFQISDSVMSWYQAKAYTEPIALHYESFVEKCKAKGYTYLDWDAAFRNAIADDWAKARVRGRNETHIAHETHAQRMSKHLAKLTAAEFGSDVGIGAV